MQPAVPGKTWAVENLAGKQVHTERDVFSYLRVLVNGVGFDGS